MSNATGSTMRACPIPFLSQGDYSRLGGYVDGRVCATVNALGGTSCCLPCPYQDLVYSDAFPHMLNAVSWIGVPALVLQIFLLLTFVALPEKDGHGHYLNWGMVISVVFLELCFIVPLGAKPDLCFDRITPNDMTSSLACAWSGALLLAGAMATIAWILVRSLHTHLRVVWNLELPKWYPVVSHTIGWGLPALFLAISLPLNGLSYQFGSLCFPKQRGSSANWVGWYLAFSAFAVILQLCTTVYCGMVYAASFRPEAQRDISTDGTQLSTLSNTPLKPAPVSGMYRKQRSWRTLQKVVLLQWRSIVLSILVAFGAIYFSVVYVTTADIRQQQLTASNMYNGYAWVYCLVASEGDKHPCMAAAAKLGLNEAGAIASLALVSLTGVGTFFLMVRRSMFIGWYHILHNPRQYLRSLGRRKSSIEETFVFVTPQDRAHDAEKGIAHDKGETPEPANVTQRHEPSSMFDDDAPEVNVAVLPPEATHIERVGSIPKE